MDNEIANDTYIFNERSEFIEKNMSSFEGRKLKRYIYIAHILVCGVIIIFILVLILVSLLISQKNDILIETNCQLINEYEILVNTSKLENFNYTSMMFYNSLKNYEDEHFKCFWNPCKLGFYSITINDKKFKCVKMKKDIYLKLRKYINDVAIILFSVFLGIFVMIEIWLTFITCF